MRSFSVQVRYKVYRSPSHVLSVPGSFVTEVKDWAEGVTSGANMTGRLLVTFMIISNIIAMILYIIDVRLGLVEECVSWEERVTIQIDFALGIIFCLHSFLRLLAAESFSSWLFSLATMVDILTLPSLFLSVWLKRTWIGLRYWRFCMLVELPDVLVYVRLLQKSSSIRLAQLTSKILGFLLAFAGLVYVLENQGDFHHDYTNARAPGDMRFIDSIWFLIITSSTVGYGDYFPVTDFGKLVVLLFISCKF